MQIAGAQPDPIHRRQVADRIALMAVQNELRRRRGARGEIKQHRIVGARLAVGRKRGRRRIAGLEGNPAWNLLADHDAGVVARQVGEFRRGIGVGDDMAHTAAREAVGEIVAGQQ